MFNYKTITSYEAACADQERDPLAEPDYSKCGLAPAQEQYHRSSFRWDIIRTSVNKDKEGNLWKPTPTERRYYFWAWINPDANKRSGFGLSFVDVNFDDSISGVASRLQFRDEPRTKFMFDTFPDLCEDIYIPQE
ncbi:MAG TPA: hypothetical protein VK644_01565 [Chitinophagaceae bacterium]|nr:hypothetical protein [Chitinophagaceae bacterium]